MKMRKEIRVYVEAELRDFSATKKAWELLQEDCIHETPIFDGQPKGSTVGNPTESKVIKLITNRRLAQLERTIKAIEHVIMNLPEDKFRLVQLKYWAHPRTLTDEGIAQEIGIDRATLYRWTDGIIKAIGVEMGLIDDICDNVATFRGS